MPAAHDHPVADETVDVSVVMPCLNERATIASCIEKAQEGLARLQMSGEIVVADNGSTDGSQKVAAALGARVVSVPEPGYGAAYRGGIAAARGRIIVMGDSDDTYDFSKLDELVRPLAGDVDMILGSRLRGNIAPGAMPWLHRYVGNPILSGLLNAFYRTRISDTHSGLRAFTRETYDRLDLRTTGMEFASEMLISAARLRLRVWEVPITYHPRAGQSKLRSFRDGWRHLRLLLLYSPTHLFTWPGGLMAVSGLCTLLALVWGPITVFRWTFDFHFMFIGSVLTILGTQVGLLGLFARSLRITPSWFTLERGLMAGSLVLLGGLGLNTYILAQWIVSGFGPLYAVRPAILALTLMVAGAQVCFGSFYLDLLRIMALGSAREPHGH